MPGFTRGFTGGARRGGDDRLAPGQYDTGSGWPVLSAELTPVVDIDTWSLTVDGLVQTPTTWDWRGIHALPASSYHGDIHCVTTWSKFDTTFTGVSVDTLLALAQPKSEATHVLATSTTGYTTNLPIDDVRDGKAWVVWEFDGSPLTAEHGGPVRMLVPHLYFWKSAKWITRIQLLDHDEQGFWERNGYHDRGDPWLEQRYQGDA
ncbi:sulfite oxidase-like oxidoreductase [Aeromicrobium sp.]|uniref:sulfite oxidase-like oxidoreductase n=1 Tax=Aeromicrobium sp. TaxID=1871063 RepID=UPI0019B3D2F4|nr:sulfite oxidase-like oxidoreductase [Aeromicrobium sp.]MBC7632785.1 sulfite oxidase-like oxidoreductase [Aeromicrobium sp.]